MFDTDSTTINLIKKYIAIYYSTSAKYNKKARELYSEGKRDESAKYIELAKKHLLESGIYQ